VSVPSLQASGTPRLTRSVGFFQIRLLYKSAREIFWSADLSSALTMHRIAPFFSCGAVFMAARAGQAVNFYFILPIWIKHDTMCLLSVTNSL
jgi:hypothetical protein